MRSKCNSYLDFLEASFLKQLHTSSSGQHPIYQFCNHSLGSCTAEVSDQNLVDEDQGKKTSNIRCKKLEDDGSSRCFEPRSMGTIDNSIFNKTYAKGEKKKLVWKGSCPESSVYSYMLPDGKHESIRSSGL
ncbi:hypothetical protein ES319_D02G241800v1 [Gossypium barbadense]|uniref:Uncharacterized protein n=1 Tax=Gossypium barbadense TaxID=3634 RepID=A0A5J5SGU2_GOSBA|nr:hypothetical protein ES319_D02G241800v1 [Gossypium barbadense]